jgi:heme-degrading monooxygenase HmoA
MHARHITLLAREGSLEHIASVLLQVVLPAAQRQPGFSGGMLMSDPETGKIVTLTLWNSEEEMMRVSEGSEYIEDQISRIISFVKAPPVIEHYQVDILS